MIRRNAPFGTLPSAWTDRTLRSAWSLFSEKNRKTYR